MSSGNRHVDEVIEARRRAHIDTGECRGGETLPGHNMRCNNTFEANLAKVLEERDKELNDLRVAIKAVCTIAPHDGNVWKLGQKEWKFTGRRREVQAGDPCLYWEATRVDAPHIIGGWSDHAFIDGTLVFIRHTPVKPPDEVVLCRSCVPTKQWWEGRQDTREDNCLKCGYGTLWRFPSAIQETT